MIDARFEVSEINKSNSERVYDNLQELFEDFPLGEEEVNSLYKGIDLEKSWAKRRWLISLMAPED